MYMYKRYKNASKTIVIKSYDNDFCLPFIVACKRDCLNNGTCGNDGVCYCEDGFLGDYCQIKGKYMYFNQGSKISLDRRPKASDFNLLPINSRPYKSGAVVFWNTNT